MRKLLSVLTLCAGNLLAQGTLEVISLRHRTVEQVLPVLRPLLEPGAVMSGQFNQLIVRTSPRNLADIRAALEAIDTPLRRLVISVRHDFGIESRREELEAGGRIPGRVEIRVSDSRSALEERVDQRILVLEGGRAFISSSESRPLRQLQVVPTPGGAVVAESVALQEAATGFEVVPRVSGSVVLLEIAPRRETFAPGTSGAPQSERAATSVSARLGEWIELGGTGAIARRDDRGILSTRASHSSSGRRVWLKVEEVRP